MLDRDLRHLLLLTVTIDAEEAIGDGCSIGVIDTFRDLLPIWNPGPSRLPPPADWSTDCYRLMTVAYSLDEE